MPLRHHCSKCFKSSSPSFSEEASQQATTMGFTGCSLPFRCNPQRAGTTSTARVQRVSAYHPTCVSEDGLRKLPCGLRLSSASARSRHQECQSHRELGATAGTLTRSSLSTSLAGPRPSLRRASCYSCNDAGTYWWQLQPTEPLRQTLLTPASWSEEQRGGFSGSVGVGTPAPRVKPLPDDDYGIPRARWRGGRLSSLRNESPLFGRVVAGSRGTWSHT